MRRHTLTTAARSDIVAALKRSVESFGIPGRRRYEALIKAAIRDVATDPMRPGSRDRPELGAGVRSFHLTHSRERARSGDGIVRTPRHALFYHCPDERTVEILRLLHDAMDLHRHLP